MFGPDKYRYAGDVTLVEMAEACLLVLTPAERVDFQRFMGSFTSSVPLRWASGCSGTESPLYAYRNICAATKSVLGTVVHVRHTASAELNAGKRKFILHTLPATSQLFANVYPVQLLI